jgi:hypothetical protein
VKFYFQNIQSRIRWRCGSSSRAPALQALEPEFKPLSHQKERKKEGRKEGRKERKEKRKKERKKLYIYQNKYGIFWGGEPYGEGFAGH